MKKIETFKFYFNESEISQNLIPIDVYFMKSRTSKTPEIINNTVAKPIKVKPNFINKIGYTGYEHNLPTGCISQIVDLEKLL